MLSFEDQLQLTEMRGLHPETARWLALEGEAEGMPGVLPCDPASRQHWALELRRRGMSRPGARLEWPAPGRAEELAVRLRSLGVRLLWRKQKGYPGALETRLGAQAPAWLWCSGALGRLTKPAVAIVGSRETRPRLLEPAERLGRALAESGRVVVSGLARGADTAAHRGASLSGAGTLVIPARGILPSLAEAGNLPGRAVTLLALDRPEAGFNAGLALRRNALIVAMASVVVLVASGPRGGSLHAVHWAERWGTPLACFEDGLNTPAVNRRLIEGGQAAMLKISDPPERWIELLNRPLPKSHHKPGSAFEKLDGSRLAPSFLPEER